ncbi:Uncharacterized protein FWK35_00004939 [Aphis craccivora]|uniref:Uncharacterized protein n=1 Tax=Aphis craccivora TaxID=307492 RepID=A0A6G0ZF19_APHCR|nr:Uncharacterized protein FWK35_00004939 [Aphis craccivora]
MSIISRPASSFSQCKPGTGYVVVFPNLSPNTSRPVYFNTSHEQIITIRLHSRSSLQSHKEPISRPLSRTSVQSVEFNRPITRAKTKSCDEIYQTKPMSRIPNQDRPEHQ